MPHHDDWFIDDWNKAIAEHMTPLSNEKRRQKGDFEKLIRLDTEEGKKARAALFFMSIHQKDSQATDTIKELVKDNVHAKVELFSLIKKAFSQDSSDHDTRMAYIGMLNNMLDAKPPQISKQYAGFIVHYALNEEISPENRGKDWRADTQASTRQEWLLYLMNKTGYPLAMAEVKGIAEGRGADGKPLVSEKVRRRAELLYQKLEDTRPRGFDDNAQAAKLLATTVEERAKTLEVLKKPLTERLDEALSMDHFQTRKNILDACAGQPIRNPDDPRIPYLQQLLKDTDKGVAATAAWALLSSQNPVNSGDQEMRGIMRSQPFMKEALKVLETTAGIETPADDYEKLWKENSQNYLKLSSNWDLPSTYESYERGSQQKPSAEQEMFDKASRTLLYPGANTSITERKQAVEALVTLGANAQQNGNPQLQQQVFDVLKMVASRPVDQNDAKKVEIGRAHV